MNIDLIPQFRHKAPKDYSYEVEQFKSGVFSIWLCCNRKFDYNHGESTRTIWGFYDYKKCQFYSPVNSKTIGACVNITETTPYSSMKINLIGLEKFFC